MSPFAGILLSLLLSYLAGSFPTSILVGRIFFGRDIRQEGSGNAGSTNVYRVFGWKAAIAVLVVDIGKGLLATALLSGPGILSVGASTFSGLPPEAVRLLSGTAAIAGHVYSCFAGFRGGKGVATAVGMLAGLAPLSSGIILVLFLVVAGATGMVSLASLASAAGFPLLVLAGLEGRPVSPWLAGTALILSVFIFFTHRSNIGRILRGEEKRLDGIAFLRSPRRKMR